MGWLILALGAGVGLGAIMPGTVQKGGKAMRTLLCVLVGALLFLMGLKIGADRGVLVSLPSMGLKALILGGLPFLGSVLAVWIWTCLTGRKR